MRIILLLLSIVIGFVTKAQVINFNHAEFLFGGQDTITRTAFWRELAGTYSVRIDTAKKTISYPQFQVIENVSTRRNLWLGATLANSKDTVLTATTATSTLKMVSPYALPSLDLKDLQSSGDTTIAFYYLEGSVTALLTKSYTNRGAQPPGPVGKLYLAIQYPPWTIPNVGRYYRLIIFKQL